MNFTKFLEQIKWMPSLSITFIDITQMIILSFALYYLAKSLYKTRAWILVKGLLIIGGVYLVICFTNMTVLQIIMQSLFSTLLIAIIIMLQPELQRIVELIGKRNLTDVKSLLFKQQETASWYSEKTIDEIASACEIMSAAKTGALIAVERGIPLEEYSHSGIGIGSAVSQQLLVNIFEKNTPLHDGAVIITNDKIESATCYLPLSSNYSVDKTFGTRHRAALGIAESTDCISIVVSEETGAISICIDGRINHDIDKSELSSILKEKMKRNDEKLIVRKRFRAPLWMKICAPIVSMIIWISVTASTDPVVTKAITDIPVTVINTEVLDNAEHAYTIKSGQTVSVRVQGRRSLVDNMTKNDLFATADFSMMSIVYAVPIDIQTTQEYAGVEIITGNNSIMKLEIEDMVQTEIPIEIEVVGDTNDDYVVCLQDMETDTLVVTCPQSLATTLDKAILTIDAYGKETDFISTASPIVYNKSGEKVQDKIIINQESIRVSMSVYMVKEVPFTITLTKQDETSEVYYVLNGYTAESNTVKIAAADEKISNIQNINIVISPNASSENASSILINLRQHIPDNVYFAKNQNEQISVSLNLIKYQKQVIELSANDIRLTGYDTNKISAIVTDAPPSIVLYCNSSVIGPESITLKTLNPTLKVQETYPGRYECEITITDIEGVVVVGELVASYKIYVKGEG